MILKNACNVIFSKRFCNLLPLFLGQGNTAVVVIDADTTVKVASICEQSVNLLHWDRLYTAVTNLE